MNKYRLDQAIRELSPEARDIFDYIQSPGVRIPGTAERRYDAEAALFSARQLEHVMSETYTEEFPDLVAVNGEIANIDTSVPEGAKNFTYYVYTGTAVCQWIDAYSAGDLPEVNVKQAEVNAPLHVKGNSYGWTTEELRNAAFGNYPLETEEAAWARRGHDEFTEDVWWYGDLDMGLPGILSIPNCLVTKTTTWVGKSLDLLLADIYDALNASSDFTAGREKATRQLYPRNLWRIINERRLGAGDGTLTIIDQLRKTYPDIEFGMYDRLEAKNSDGNLDRDVILTYNHKDKKKVAFVEAMPYTQHPMQYNGLKMLIPTENKIGGVKCPYPLSVHRLEVATS